MNGIHRVCLFVCVYFIRPEKEKRKCFRPLNSVIRFVYLVGYKFFYLFLKNGNKKKKPGNNMHTVFVCVALKFVLLLVDILLQVELEKKIFHFCFKFKIMYFV